MLLYSNKNNSKIIKVFKIVALITKELEKTIMISLIQTFSISDSTNSSKQKERNKMIILYMG